MFNRRHMQGSFDIKTVKKLLICHCHRHLRRATCSTLQCREQLHSVKSCCDKQGLRYWLCNVFFLSKWNKYVSENPIFLHRTGTQWESQDATVHWRYTAVNDLCYRINIPPALGRSALGSRVMLACPLWSTEELILRPFQPIFASNTFQDDGAQILPQLLKWAHPTSILKGKYLHFFYSLCPVNQCQSTFTGTWVQSSIHCWNGS